MVPLWIQLSTAIIGGIGGTLGILDFFWVRTERLKLTPYAQTPIRVTVFNPMSRSIELESIVVATSPEVNDMPSSSTMIFEGGGSPLLIEPRRAAEFCLRPQDSFEVLAETVIRKKVARWVVKARSGKIFHATIAQFSTTQDRLASFGPRSS